MDRASVTEGQVFYAMIFAQLATTALIAGMAVLVAAERVVAASPICASLEAQLMTMDRVGGDSDSVHEYDALTDRRRNEIEQAISEARRAGCVGGPSTSALQSQLKCVSLVAMIERLEANPDRLVAHNRSAGDPLATRKQRDELQRALEANGCGVTGPGGRGSRGGLYEVLYGGGEDSYLADPTSGGFRTLCVRTCDGYYFPISFSTVPYRFDQDAERCHALCPGADVSLYIHRNTGEDSDAMISLAGEPYTALPTAYKYRREYDPACSCGSTLTALTARRVPPADANPAMDEALEPMRMADPVPMPPPRPTSTLDPEVSAAQGEGAIGKTDTTADKDVVPDGDSASGRIRVVGPSYYEEQ